MVTHDMSWITAFCTRAILLDRGRIVAEGDPDDIAELHEESADARRKAERKKKQAIKRGAAPATNVRRARRERSLDDLAVGIAGVPGTNGSGTAPEGATTPAQPHDEESAAATPGPRSS
jgi:ABC-type multidrug transport system ATPase subunit